MEGHSSKRTKYNQDSNRKENEDEEEEGDSHLKRMPQSSSFPSISPIPWSPFPSSSVPILIANTSRNLAPYLGSPMEYSSPSPHHFNVNLYNNNNSPHVPLPHHLPPPFVPTSSLHSESNPISMIINNDDDNAIEDVAKSLRSFSEDARNAYSNNKNKGGSTPNKKQEGEPPSSIKQDINKCGKCGLALVPEKNISFNGRSYHSGCFTCHVCSEPLESSSIPLDDNLYCERDYAKLMENRKEKDLPEDLQLSLNAQPAKFQIANYNIHPPPALTISTPLDDNYTVYVHLCEAQHYKVISGGIQSGDIRVLRTNQTTIYFNGLKLNKMGPIKTEMNYRNSRQLNSDFCIRFKIGNKVFYSSNFKLVSSCSQLTQEVRENVRPSKKTLSFTGGKLKSESTSPPESSDDRTPPLEAPLKEQKNTATTIESTSNNATSLGHSIHNLMNSNEMSLPNIQSFNMSIGKVPMQHEAKDGSDMKRVSISSTVKSETSFEARAFTYSRPVQYTETTEEGQWLRNEFERCVSNGDPEGAALYGAKLAEFTKKHRA
eukprot:TRINITY_DN1188_c0_g1_i1.p1 TRINITY_DN1188_c0_g1~~TRINITY_DN1188_c0_g1_i1.p1  ORF type:complete len:545 (-),score=112.67 TRINITY_DN1188_c0_g1_i1:180-1814(-)